MELERLARRLQEFATERDWEKFHTPRNLALALVGEVGELAELLQWRSDADVVAWSASEPGRRQIADELADVLIYLVRLADVIGIDLAAETDRKLIANERRYPADEVRGSATKRTGAGD